MQVWILAVAVIIPLLAAGIGVYFLVKALKAKKVKAEAQPAKAQPPAKPPVTPPPVQPPAKPPVTPPPAQPPARPPSGKPAPKGPPPAARFVPYVAAKPPPPAVRFVPYVPARTAPPQRPRPPPRPPPNCPKGREPDPKNPRLCITKIKDDKTAAELERKRLAAEAEKKRLADTQRQTDVRAIAEVKNVLDRVSKIQNLPGPYAQLTGSDGLTYFVHESNPDKAMVVRELVRMQADARIVQSKLLETPDRALGVELANMAPKSGASRIVGCSTLCRDARGWQMGDMDEKFIFMKIDREPEPWANMYRWYFLHELSHAAVVRCGGCPHNYKFWDTNRRVLLLAYKVLPPAPRLAYKFREPLSFDQFNVVRDGRYPDYNNRRATYGQWNPADPGQWPTIQAQLLKLKNDPNFGEVELNY